jgi:hypothetical protein
MEEEHPKYKRHLKDQHEQVRKVSEFLLAVFKNTGPIAYLDNLYVTEIAKLTRAEVRHIAAKLNPPVDEGVKKRKRVASPLPDQPKKRQETKTTAAPKPPGEGTEITPEDSMNFLNDLLKEIEGVTPLEL